MLTSTMKRKNGVVVLPFSATSLLKNYNLDEVFIWLNKEEKKHEKNIEYLNMPMSIKMSWFNSMSLNLPIFITQSRDKTQF